VQSGTIINARATCAESAAGNTIKFLVSAEICPGSAFGQSGKGMHRS